MNQRRLWSDADVIAARRKLAEEAMRRPLELPGHEYTEAEKAASRAHLERVTNGAPVLAVVKESAA